VIRLESGDWSATVLPSLGGALLNLDYAGQPVLRPTQPGTTDILQTACFPLVPYANRIAGGHFEFGGRAVDLPVQDRFSPHALHGDGWLRAWSVEKAGEGHAVLRLSGGGDHWPWPWRADQTLKLDEEGLRVTLSVTNLAEEVAPVGLGLHPYFHRSEDARLTLKTGGVWLTDESQIPARLAEPAALVDWSSGRDLTGAPFVDHAYADWSRKAWIDGAGRRVEMTASEACRWVQVYAPHDENFLCVEPVTHRPDALNAPPGEATGMTTLQPGQALTIWMRIATIN
jgi:aldose 1-epimerase